MPVHHCRKTAGVPAFLSVREKVNEGTTENADNRVSKIRGAHSKEDLSWLGK
ncbi:hypothetical protein C8R34_12158 [Nitrosomonas sp. Nm84]|nr:hypothetical protein C8R34_12158 [Nitrosomonas sp. Nm84]